MYTDGSFVVSPTWSRGSVSRPLRPFETNPLRVSAPGDLHKLRTVDTTVSNRFPRQPYSPINSPVTKALDRKKSFWQSIRRKSDSALDEKGQQPEVNSPTPGSRRGRRGLENSFHSSIDLTSADAKHCPRIVRAAQAGAIEELESLLESGADKEAVHKASKRNALMVASHCGHEEVVELLLRHDARISQKDYLQNMALHLAAARGHLGVMKLLVSDDADIEARGPTGQTALRLSCDGGHYEAVEYLLRQGAKVNARDDSHLTSLHAAAKRGDVHAVELLVRHGAHIGAKDAKFFDAMHYACHHGRNQVIDFLLNSKADIESVGSEGMTPLITAAAAGHTHTVDLLLRRKAKLKAQALGSMTVLHWAAFNGHLETVDLLIQRKASLGTVNSDGRTALHLAVMAEHFSVVDLLLQKLPAIHGPCKGGLTPLHYACGSDSTAIALRLLHSGANIEAVTGTQERPLHIAVTEEKLTVVNMLLENNAQVDARNTAGDRALLIASSKGNAEIVKALLDRGALLRSRFSTFGPSHEDSPLCIAAKNGHADVVDLLISRGASVREKDEHDWQPLRYGAYYGHPEVVERLLAAGASLSSMQSWGFNRTSTTLGFAQNVYIPEDQKEHVTILLRNAEERERTEEASLNERLQERWYDQQNGSAELDNGAQVQMSELRPSTTRAGSNLARRFSFERPSDMGGQRDSSETDRPEGASIKPDRLQFKSNNPFRTQTPPSESGNTSGSEATIPTRTASEHVPNKYKDITSRWQKVSTLPTRSATVASNSISPLPVQQQPKRLTPMSSLREVVSPLSSRTYTPSSIVSPTPIPAPQQQSYNAPYYTLQQPPESYQSYQSYQTISSLDSNTYTTNPDSTMPYSPESFQNPPPQQNYPPSVPPPMQQYQPPLLRSAQPYQPSSYNPPSPPPMQYYTPPPPSPPPTQPYQDHQGYYYGSPPPPTQPPPPPPVPEGKGGESAVEIGGWAKSPVGVYEMG
jgi:ankyrin repeat protein